MLFKNKSSKTIFIRFLLLIPILFVMVAFRSQPTFMTNESKVPSWSPIMSNFSANQQQDTGKVFLTVEVQPEPPGGIGQFIQYVGKNYSYPKEAVDAKVKGRILVSFVVNKDGKLSDVKSLRDLGYGTGEEAVRVV